MVNIDLLLDVLSDPAYLSCRLIVTLPNLYFNLFFGGQVNFLSSLLPPPDVPGDGAVCAPRIRVP